MTIQTAIARLCLALALGAFAHSVNAARIGILTEDVDQDGVQCGITREAIEGRARAALGAAGVSISELRSDYTLYLSNTVVSTPKGICVAVIAVQVYTLSAAPESAEFRPRSGTGTLVVCNVQNLWWSDIGTFRDGYLNSVERATKNCLGKLSYK